MKTYSVVVWVNEEGSMSRGALGFAPAVLVLKDLVKLAKNAGWRVRGFEVLEVGFDPHEPGGAM